MKQLSQNPLSEFKENYLLDLQNKIDRALALGALPIAAFDADGTLWDIDVGESFFEFQIQHCALGPLKDIADPWQHYRDLKNQDHRAAYTWLAQINEGLKLAQVREWAAKAVDQVENFPVLTSMQKLIKFLQSRKVQIFVVTASIKWAVEPAAHKFYGIPAENVLGVGTKVAGPEQVVTAEGLKPVTWREGKAEALLMATKGKKPLLAAGNTDGDIAMLETASHIHLAVMTQDVENALFGAEIVLQKEALRRGWMAHCFRKPLLT